MGACWSEYRFEIRFCACYRGSRARPRERRDEPRESETVKVLHVIPSVSLKHGGPSKAVRLFAEAAMHEGVLVSIATTDDNGDGSHLEVARGIPLWENGVEFFYFRRTTLAYKVSI